MEFNYPTFLAPHTANIVRWENDGESFGCFLHFTKRSEVRKFIEAYCTFETFQHPKYIDIVRQEYTKGTLFNIYMLGKSVEVDLPRWRSEKTDEPTTDYEPGISIYSNEEVDLDGLVYEVYIYYNVQKPTKKDDSTDDSTDED